MANGGQAKCLLSRCIVFGRGRLQTAYRKKNPNHTKTAENNHTQVHAGQKSRPRFRAHRTIPHEMIENHRNDGHAAKHAQGSHGGHQTGCTTIVSGADTPHDRNHIGR